MKRVAVILFSVLLLFGCDSKYVAKVADEKISTGEFNFYLSSIKSQMAGTELTSDEDWQTQEIEGRRAIDVAKDMALEAALENISYIEVADYLNIELTDSEEKTIDMMMDNVVAQYGGEANFDIFLKSQGIDDDFIEMLCKAEVYSKKLSKLAVEQNPITDAERKAEFEELSKIKYKAKHILFATIDTNTQEKLADDEISKKKALAEDIYSKVLLSSDADIFDKFMNEYSEDPGLMTNPDGYLFGSGEMVAPFENTTASLEIGGVGFTESDFGYHIIKRLPITFEELTEDIESSLSDKRLASAMTQWKELAGIKVTKNESVFQEIV